MRGSQAPATSAPIVGWAVDPKRVLRPPAGVSLVVLDTPGGLHGFDLARVAAFADVILMPVCNSAFDRESAADCHAELMALAARRERPLQGRRGRHAARRAHPRRRDARAPGPPTIKLPFVAALREAQVYVRGIERGAHAVRSARRQESPPTSRSGSRSSSGSSRSSLSCTSRRFVAMPRSLGRRRKFRPASRNCRGCVRRAWPSRHASPRDTALRAGSAGLSRLAFVSARPEPHARPKRAD